MKRFGYLLIFLALIGGMSACNNVSEKAEKKEKNILTTSGGRTSEVLVVMGDQNWKKTAGDTIRATLSEVPAWLAAPEPEYRISQINKSQFGTVYKKFRNILIVQFKPELKKAKITFVRNKWAKPQIIATIQAPDLQSFLDIYTENLQRIKDYYHNNELFRIAEAYKGMEEKGVTDKLIKKFSIKMVFPRGFYVATEGADFMWIRRPTAEVEEGVMIYTYPYSDTADFNYHKIIAIRDSITRKYIPGPVDSSFMRVSRVFPPVVSKVLFKGNYATELRSWWDVKGYAMGGPFISYTFVDTVANRMICLDGYIKAPNKDKRDLLLHIEAIFSTFEFVNNTDAKKD
jgi:hypothetical protein